MGYNLGVFSRKSKPIESILFRFLTNQEELAENSLKINFVYLRFLINFMVNLCKYDKDT